MNTLSVALMKSRAEVDRLRHDIRTPLNHILGYSELLIETAQDHQRLDLIVFLKHIRDIGRSVSYSVATIPTLVSERAWLREVVSPKLDSIVGELNEVVAHAKNLDDPPFFCDLARIRFASEQLQALVSD